jgi:hypothetical protein
MRTRAVVTAVGLSLTLTACGTAAAQTGTSATRRHTETVYACVQKSGSRQISDVRAAKHGCRHGSYVIIWSVIIYRPLPKPKPTRTPSPPSASPTPSMSKTTAAS